MYQIAWTRVLALTIGPTTYALAATLTAFIGGLAIGSGAGAIAAGRSRRPAFWLVVMLACAAIATTVTASLAGGWVPRLVAHHIAGAADDAGLMVSRNALLVAALVVPATIGLGAAFPLALATIGAASADAARRVGLVYAANAIACVGGALAAGFFFIPVLGLQRTLQLVGVILMAAVLLVVYWGTLKVRVRVAGFLACTAVTAVIVSAPPWDRELLASGVYKYAHFVADNVDLEEALKAGTLLYYREGAAATVSVKKLTGTLALAIDGKVDASNGSDMLNQKMAAHLPLLLHERPRQVGIIGLGSGVTLASALVHPIERADVIEISPEVVEASTLFAAENRKALSDPRARLIVGDGRSHLALSSRQYDVLISEPSNPWIAGVAALFTREFFLAARSRLAPGGLICQWAHTYNISDRDLRSIVSTFTSVFPNGTAWLIGQDDVLLVAGAEPLDGRLANVETGWTRPGVADDLRTVAAGSPFTVWSMFVAGPRELTQYANGAPLQTDDRMALEFTGPRGMNTAGEQNAIKLAALLASQGGPPFIQRIRDSATAADWRTRGAMLLAGEMYGSAYETYARAAALDPTDADGVEGLVRSASMAGQMAPALDRVKSLAAANQQSAPLRVAESKLLAASGALDEAVEAAKGVRADHPSAFVALEQHASLLATIGDAEALDVVVAELRRVAPARAATAYYGAVTRMLRHDFKGAVEHATRAVALDPGYAASYDLLGAARVKLGEAAAAREAFETSLRYNRRDSTAYANLGILELEASNPEGAADYFAEALWLDPDSAVAREGLAQARSRR
jgi:spermidine synthase